MKQFTSLNGKQAQLYYIVSLSYQKDDVIVSDDWIKAFQCLL